RRPCTRISFYLPYRAIPRAWNADNGRSHWRAQGESNPCFRRERATSWTARRWARAAEAIVAASPKSNPRRAEIPALAIAHRFVSAWHLFAQAKARLTR